MAKQHMTIDFDTESFRQSLERAQAQLRLAAERALAVKNANPALKRAELGARCSRIADQVVPEYRGGKPRSCTGHYAKRWQAAWDGACVALGGDPARYRL